VNDLNKFLHRHQTMVLVELGEKDISYFKNLEAIDPWTHHSVHPDEVSGALTVEETTPGKHEVKIAELSTGHRTGADLPPGAVSFHTHNVAPGDVFHPNMSTDVPSWQDFRTIAIQSLTGGLKDHLVFTPNYSYVISVGPTLMENLREQARLSKNSLTTFATGKTQGRYTALVNHIGANYGSNFIAHWIEEMRSVGFVIEQRREGQPLYFDYTGPLPASQDMSVPLDPDAPDYTVWAIIAAVALLVLMVLYVIWK